MRNSTVIKFSRMTLRWLCDAASVCLTATALPALATHPDGMTDTHKPHDGVLICCLTWQPWLEPFSLFVGINIRDGVARLGKATKLTNGKTSLSLFRSCVLKRLTVPPYPFPAAAVVCSSSGDTASPVHVQLLHYCTTTKSRPYSFAWLFPLLDYLYDIRVCFLASLHYSSARFAELNINAQV